MKSVIDAKEMELWQSRATDPGARDAIYALYADACTRIAEAMLAKWYLPAKVDVDSLRSVAQIAVLEAIGKFDPDRNVSFRTFAMHRMRGAMLDELRRRDIPRLARRRTIQRMTAENDLAQQLGRLPTETEVMDHLRWTRREYLMSTMRVAGQFADLETRRQVWNAASNLRQQPEHMDEEVVFRELCKGLSVEEQTLLFLYYWRDNTMKVVGQVLRLSESRVSQMHSRLMAQLRERGKDLISDALH